MGCALNRAFVGLHPADRHSTIDGNKAELMVEVYGDGIGYIFFVADFPVVLFFLNFLIIETDILVFLIFLFVVSILFLFLFAVLFLVQGFLLFLDNGLINFLGDADDFAFVVEFLPQHVLD